MLKKYTPIIFLDFYSKIKYTKHNSNYLGLKTEDVFTSIYSKNSWGNNDSVSGVGSSLKHTKKIIPQLNELIDKLKITSLLDLPCGDFNWIKNIDLSKVNYLGADIVPEIITVNKKKHEQDFIKFQKINLITDKLKSFDAILIRDCFVHFSYLDIKKSLKNIKDSKSEYLITTTFTKQAINYDITTGDWRPINLEKVPFNFPPPIMLIKEQYNPNFKKEFRGKSLGIWKISELEQFI